MITAMPAEDDPLESGLFMHLLTVVFSNSTFRRVLAAVVVVPLFLYGLEDLALRMRIPPFRHPIGQVDVHRIYMLHKTQQKTYVVNSEPAPQDCVRALFPHLDKPACWWLARHTEQTVDYD